MPQPNGLHATRRTKAVAMLAAAIVCALSAFPPRIASNEVQFPEVPRSFLFGDVNVATVVVRDGQYGSSPMTARIACRIEMARLATEWVVVLSAATVAALLLHMRALQPSDEESGETTAKDA